MALRCPARRIDRGPAAAISWAIGGLLALVLALSWARMTEVLSRSGATARYPFHSHGSLAGFLLGRIRILAVVTIPAIEAEAVVTALEVVLLRTHVALSLTSTGAFAGEPITTLDPGGIAIALALLLGFFLLNARGVEWRGRATTVATVWKLVVPSATILGLFAVAQWSNFSLPVSNGTGGFLPHGWPAVFFAVATSGVMFAYLGFA
jgi:amino acid transporter